MDMQAVLKWTPDQQKDRLNALEQIFGTPGWRIIVKWAIEDRAMAVEQSANAKTWDENRILLGNIQVYDDLITMQEGIMREYEVMAEEAEAEYHRNIIVDPATYE